MARQEAWANYYSLRERPALLGDHREMYVAAVQKLAHIVPQILDPERRQNFVLGGFYPHIRNRTTFLEMCKQLHDNPEDRHIFLDMNAAPLEHPSVRNQPYKVQAVLQALPFDGSIDFIFLDHTFEYMNAKDIKAFAESAKVALSPQGLALALLAKPSRIPLWDRIGGRLENHVPVRTYRRDTLEKLTRVALKPVFIAETKPLELRDITFQLMVFASHESSLPAYTGKALEFA